jgi:Immunity protein Imm1
VEVHLLRVTIYDDDGWTWRTEEIQEPTWADIEAAIRRLDRFHYPFVMLYRSTVAKLDITLEFSDAPDFDVVGGEGEFAMEATTDSSCHRYYDQSRGDELIEIWRSDQGVSFEKKYCCPSLDSVLKATRYFCEHGALDPDLTWQPQPW